MLRLSTAFVILLVFVLLTLISAVSTASDWPVKRSIDLSSGFGDFRENRFHTGVDIRTGGVEGEEIYSPVAGYVYRIKMSYEGFGKGLYIKGDDGYIYVFGHLSNFSGDVDKPVKMAQLKDKRYYQDIFLPEDSIRIAKGEFIGYTGQTGVGAPHLHFEKRTGDNFPLNPLNHGFSLQDTVEPVFVSIGFKMTDGHSLFDNGVRELIFGASPGDKAGSYILDTVLYLHRPFGVLTETYDQMRAGGMKQTVYKLSLYIDDNLYYQVVFDTLDFETSRAVNLEYDYLRVVHDEKRVHRLFHKPNNAFAGSRAINSVKGIFGLEGDEKIGIHRGKIRTEDCFGNTAELLFEFLWGPEQYIYTLDSASTAPAGSTFFCFTPIKGYEGLNIDSVMVIINKGKKWGPLIGSKVTYLDDGRIKCEVVGRRVRTAVLRLLVFSDGCVISDNLFSGILERGKNATSLDYQILDDGLLVTINVKARTGSKARLEFYHQDSLLGIEYPQFINITRYVCFVAPSKKLSLLKYNEQYSSILIC